MTARALDFTSSAFTQMVYDDETEQLIATFKDGATYAYSMPQDFVDQWMQADSIGGFYNTNVRGQFSFAHYEGNRNTFGD